MKKLIFLSFLMIFLVISTNVYAEETKQSIKINNTTLTFNKVYYVDGSIGDDVTGDGSINKPLKSLTKAVNLCASSGDAVFIKGKLTNQYVETGVKTLSIIGDYLKYGSELEEFNLETNYLNNYNRPYGNVTFYNLYLHSSRTGAWSESLAVLDVNLYNCVFEETCENSDVYGNYKFTNCLIGRIANLSYGTTSFSNCAFKLSNLGSTTNCIYNATVDSQFNITSVGWKNTGADTNPDGSQANIGVYGGQFAWGCTTTSDAPINVKAVAGDKKIDLTWDTVANATSYNLKRSTATGGPYTAIATSVTTAVYSDTTVTNGTTYYYVVSAVSASGESLNSNEVSAQIKDMIVNNNEVINISFYPTTALYGTGIFDGDTNTGWIHDYSQETKRWVKWEMATPKTISALSIMSGVDGQGYTALRDFRLYGSQTGVFSGEEILLYSGTNIADTNFHNHTFNNTTKFRWYKLEGDWASGQASKCYEIQLFTQEPDSKQVPSTPTNLIATVNSRQVNLSWNDVTDASSFNIKRSTTLGGSYTTIASNITGTSYSDTTVTGVNTYYYIVTASNAAGESPNSNEVSTQIYYNEITAYIRTDKSKYIRNDAVEVSLKLSNTQPTYKTNSVTFEVEYDSSRFELASNNVEADAVSGYIPFNIKMDLGNGSNKRVLVTYVNEKDISLQENEKVLTVNFKVKPNAVPGTAIFTLKPIDMIDSSYKVYTVNNQNSVLASVEITNDAVVEGYLNLYAGDSGTELNNLVLNSLNHAKLNETLRNLKFTLKQNAQDTGSVLKGSDVFLPDENGNIGWKDVNNKLTGKFRIYTQNTAYTILRIDGVGYLTKEIGISLSQGQVHVVSMEIYPGDLGQVVSNQLVLTPDGKITNVDYSALLKIFNDNISGTASEIDKLRADMTKDGVVDNVDFSLWLASYKKVLTIAE